MKLSAAKFLIQVLEDIKEHPHNACQIERPRRKHKNLTYWKMPQLYGDETVVTSKVLPLGFQFHGKEPNQNRCVQPHQKT